jgi:hypothetical protein
MPPESVRDGERGLGNMNEFSVCQDGARIIDAAST